MYSRPYYNIYLNSPQRAVDANRKKYYLHVISENQRRADTRLTKYPPTYYYTSYKKIIFPNQIIAEL